MSIVLDATTKKLELVCGSTGTASNLQWMTSYADKSSTSFTPGTSDGVSNGTTDVTIVDAPSVSEQRLVNNINIYNADTVEADVTVNLDNDGTERILVKTELNSGDTLQYANDQWRVVDENGAYKQTITAEADNISIADAGDIITAEDVEGALQENRTAIDLNTTHRTSNGTDHSYIDQDVTEDAEVTFDTLTLTGSGGGTVLDISDGNIKVANGHGIDFSATSDAAGMTSELLDDYEEGTWTPVIGGTTSETGQSYSLATGFYTSTGNMVICSCTVRLSDKGTIVGSLAIKGLPYESKSDIYGAVGTSYFTALATNWTNLFGYISANTTYLNVRGTQAANTSTTSLTTTDVTDTTGLYIVFSYIRSD